MAIDSLLQIFPDNFCRREVLSLTVRCKNKANGCDWLAALKELEVSESKRLNCGNSINLSSCTKRIMKNHVIFRLSPVLTKDAK